MSICVKCGDPIFGKSVTVVLASKDNPKWVIWKQAHPQCAEMPQDDAEEFPDDVTDYLLPGSLERDEW